ncbi:MAG: inner membrane CreD family protein [Acidobacteriota bacterium]
MTRLRLVPIVFIYVIATFAWFTLGSSVLARSGEFDDRLSHDVALLWGGPQVQTAPTLTWEERSTIVEQVDATDASGRSFKRPQERVNIAQIPVSFDSSRVDVKLALDHRRKGLLWYDTYGVGLRATYRAHNDTGEPRLIVAHLTFPSDQVQFDNFRFRINGQDATRTENLTQGATASVLVSANGPIVVELTYDSRGLDTWSYTFAPKGVAQIKDFELTMQTDFAEVDYPAGSMSPSSAARAGAGWNLAWTFDSLLTGRSIGMDLPNLQNPGPLAARITYFAPVALLFYLSVMVILGVLRSQNLHPMHYAFISAAFFAFHLLLAYLVDHLSIHWSFAIASATSILLVASYLRIVTGAHFALARAGLAQLVFLVLFSYAFFFEGYTGLTVTVGAVLTLFILMQATARVDWTAVFAGVPQGEAKSS